MNQSKMLIKLPMHWPRQGILWRHRLCPRRWSSRSWRRSDAWRLAGWRWAWCCRGCAVAPFEQGRFEPGLSWRSNKQLNKPGNRTKENDEWVKKKKKRKKERQRNPRATRIPSDRMSHNRSHEKLFHLCHCLFMLNNRLSLEIMVFLENSLYCVYYIRWVERRLVQGNIATT